MQLVKFVFPFLFARNWHTGELEFSRPRVALFAGMMLLIVLGLLIVAFLQAPVQYSK